MITFAEALYGLSTERLRAIAKARQIDPSRLTLAPDKLRLAQFMAAELNKPHTIARAVLGCNGRELRLLQILLSLDPRPNVAWKAVVETAGGDRLDEPLRKVLTGLESLGLAIWVHDSVLVPDAIRRQVPVSLSDQYTVTGCLQSYDAPTLNRMAGRLGLPEGTKSANIQAIARRLLRPDSSLFQSISVGQPEAEVLEYLLQSGGAAPVMEVASATLHNTDEFFRYDWQGRWKSGRERNAIDRLLARGLLYVVSYSYGFNLYLVIPGDLLRALTGEAQAEFWTSPSPEPRAAAEVPGITRRHRAIIRDAVALLGFFTTQEAVRTNTGYIHKTSLKNFARALTIDDERYAAFLYAICREAGLFTTQTEKRIYRVTPAGRSWLELPALEQIRGLFTAWQQSDLWGEMYDDPLKRANEYRPRDEVTAIRAAALELAAIDRGDAFIDIVSLNDSLSFRYPLLLAQSTDFGDDLVPSPSNFMRLMIGECLYWLGLAELGWSHSGQRGAGSASGGAVTKPQTQSASSVPDSFRLTPEGSYLLRSEGSLPPDEAPVETEFILQANAEIFLPPYLDPSTLFHLLIITEPAGGAASGNIVSLTRDSIRKAMDQGVSGAEMLSFLRSHARTGIPQNVEYLINEVSSKHGHIHIGRAQMYIQVDSPLVLKELQARRELKEYFVRTLGDTVAILNASEPDKLLKDLRKAGYLPISDDAPKSARAAFGGKTPARKAPQPKPAPDAERVVAEPNVDWVRFANDDGTPWPEAVFAPVPATRPADAVKDKGNIRFLLLDAIRSRLRVQVAVQERNDHTPVVRVIEPHRVMGNFVLAYLPMEAEEVTLNINKMAWARTTSDLFAPP